MKRIVQSVSQQLWKSITIATVLVSIITGLGLYFYEREGLEERAIEMTKGLFQHAFQQGDVAQKLSDKQQLQAFLDRLVQGQFKYIELYDQQGQSLAESVSKDDSVEEILKSYKKQEKENAVHDEGYLTYYIGDDMYVQVFLPTPYGHAEVVYEVPQAIYQNMQSTLLESVLIAVLSVFLTALILYPLVKRLVGKIEKNEEEILQSNVDMLSLIGEAIAKRDSDTDEHNFRVTLYALKLAEAVGLSVPECRELIKGAFVHDIGKIAIPDAILLKPGKLDDEEFAVMKTHVSEGADIVREVKWLQQAQDVVLYHHEKYDGSGYLQGLKGEQIPLMARIFAIVDVFDALSSKRPYKDPFPLEKTLSILQESSGSHFDPNLIEVFIPLAPVLLNTYNELSRDALKQALMEEVQRYFKV